MASSSELSRLLYTVYREIGSTGLRLSLLSLGGSGYGGIYGEYNEKEAEKALRSVKIPIFGIMGVH